MEGILYIRDFVGNPEESLRVGLVFGKKKGSGFAIEKTIAQLRVGGLDRIEF
jgi:hypothetical protein